MRKKKNNINAKGREKYDGEQHVRLTYKMLNHPNFINLNPAGVKVLLGLCAKHTGFNNGKIIASYENMARGLKMGKTTVYRACQELEYYGFIKLRKLGQFYGRKANEWEITFASSEGYRPKHDWKEEKPKYKNKTAVLK